MKLGSCVSEVQMIDITYGFFTSHQGTITLLEAGKYRTRAANAGTISICPPQWSNWLQYSPPMTGCTLRLDCN